jgi:integrase
MSDIKRGSFITPHKLTVGQWLTTWLDDYARPKVRPLTFDSYHTMVHRHLIPAIGGIAMQALRPDQIQHLYNAKREKGLAGGTICSLHTVLHAALKQAVRTGLVMRNASDACTLPRKKPRAIQPLTLEQAQQLLSATKHNRLFPAIYLELGTGLRRGEILGLRWTDVDLDTGVLHVRQALARVSRQDEDEAKTRLMFHEPKTDSSKRTIPIPEDITIELRHHKARQAQERLLFGTAYQDNGLVYTEPDGRPIDPRTFTRRFARLLQ